MDIMKFIPMVAHSFRLRPTAHLLGTMKTVMLLSSLLVLRIQAKNLTVVIFVVTNAIRDNKRLALVSLLL